MKEGMIQLCEKDFDGDIPCFKYKTHQEGFNLLNNFLKSKKEESGVFVCFQVWRKHEYKRDYTKTILVSHCKNDIKNFFNQHCEKLDISEVDFNVFEFESYSESFKYCYDLQEGY